MRESKSSPIRTAPFLLFVLLVSFAPARPPNSHAWAAPSSRILGGITAEGRFLEEWSTQGSDAASIYVNGLPLTSRRPEISLEDGKSYPTQWFERARFEMHTENSPPYDVLFGRLGASLVEGR